MESLLGGDMIYWRYSPATRLGNWLFQYAVAKTLAHGGDVAFYVDPLLNDIHVRALQRRTDVMRDLKIVRELPLGASLHEGVPQDVHLMDERLVRELYKVPLRIDSFIRLKYAAILAAPLRVSVHVRRGDYLDLPHRHPFVGKSYLKQAIARFPCEALFVVCSDDLAWCRNFFSGKKFPGRTFAFVEGGNVLSDLYMATYCHHAIMSNSTFSWWGAYLNPHHGKRVILPSHWYGIALGRMASIENVTALSFSGVEVLENGYEWYMFIKAVALYIKSILGNLLRRIHLR